MLANESSFSTTEVALEKVPELLQSPHAAGKAHYKGPGVEYPSYSFLRASTYWLMQPCDRVDQWEEHLRPHLPVSCPRRN